MAFGLFCFGRTIFCLGKLYFLMGYGDWVIEGARSSVTGWKGFSFMVYTLTSN